MRIAAISDIHANLPALEAVLEDIEKLGSDVQIVVAGDLINCGPYPHQTLQMLRALPNAVIIAGNHEEYILEQVKALRENRVVAPYRTLFAPAIWAAEQLRPEELDWLRDLPRQTSLAGPEGSYIEIVHGSPRYQTEGILPETTELQLAQIFEGRVRPGTLWIAGHTHRPVIHYWRGMTIANCGSVGAPYDGDHLAAYLLAEWDERHKRWQAQTRRVAFDREKALAALWANADYNQAGPFMKLIWLNLKNARHCEMRSFVNNYIARGDYPPPPDDFLHLEQAVAEHIAAYERRAS